MINRREFLETVAAVVPAFGWQGTPANEWGGPVFDLHFHLRPQPLANLAHLDGAGVTKANLLTRGAALEQVKGLQAAAPGRFTWFNSYDVSKPDAEQVLTQSVKDGAQGFGEMKFHVAADGPELRRMYALAADLRVPILIHFQEVDHFPGEGRAPAMPRRLRRSQGLPRTTFIGHADAFWANVSAVIGISGVSRRSIKRGGVTDKLLTDHANLFGDLSANSATTPCTRCRVHDDFMKRHPDKLFVAAIAAARTGTAGSARTTTRRPPMAGKCVARDVEPPESAHRCGRLQKIVRTAPTSCCGSPREARRHRRRGWRRHPVKP
jgi:hypothetical protein